MSDGRNDDESFAHIDDIREDLTACIRPSINATHSFAHFASDARCPNPALEVSDIGTIGLPLSERDAAALRAIPCLTEYAAFENTWVINQNRIRIRNPDFDSWLRDTAIDNVIHHLGVDKTIVRCTKADLKCLVVSETGGAFPALEELSKDSTTYARLAVSLPAEHTGGLTNFSYDGSVKHTLHPTNSIAGCNYVAWFVDVKQEAKSITSGHRIVLVYDLVATVPVATATPQCARNINCSKSKLERVLGYWSTSLTSPRVKTPKFSICMLNHGFEKGSDPSLASLQDPDKAIVAQTSEVAQRAGFTICLAKSKISREGYQDQYDKICVGKDSRPDCILDTVVDLDGEYVTREVKFQEESVVPLNFFDEEHWDDECYEPGEFRDDPDFVEVYYERAVMVVIARRAFVSLLLDPILRGRGDFLLLAEKLLQAYTENPCDADRREDLRQLCDETLNKAEEEKIRGMTPVGQSLLFPCLPTYEQIRRLSDVSIAHVALAGAALKDVNIMKRALSSLWAAVPISLMRAIGYNLHLKDFEIYQDPLSQAIGQMENLKFVLEACDELQAGILQQFENQPEDVKGAFMPKVKHWTEDLLQQMLSRADLAPTETADTLFLIDSRLQGNVLTDYIIPFVQRHATDAPLAVDFLAQLSRSAKPEHAWHIVKGRFMGVFNAMIKDFQIVKFAAPKPEAERKPWEREQDAEPYLIAKPRRIERQVLPNTANSLLDRLLTLHERQSAQDFAVKLVDAGIKQAAWASSLYFEIICPFLVQMIKPLTHDYENISAIAKIPILQFLRTVKHKYVGPYPQPPADWRIPRLPCECFMCAEVSNAFNETQEFQHRYKAPENCRVHVYQKFHNMPVKLGIDTTGKPYTLVIRKTLNDIDERQRLWLERVHHHQYLVKMFDQKDLITILGDDYHRLGIPNLLAYNNDARQPLRPVSQTNGAVNARSAAQGASTRHSLANQQPYWTARPSSNAGTDPLNALIFDSLGYGQENLPSSVPAKRKAESPDHVDLTGQ